MGTQRNRSAPFWLLGLLLGVGCTQPSLVPPHPTDALHYPVSLAPAPDGDHVLVVSSNFDNLYAGGAVFVLDARTDEWAPHSAIEVESFAGDLATWPVSDDTAWAYLPERQDGGLRWFEIRPGPGDHPELACRGTPDPDSGILACDESQVETNWEDGDLAWSPGHDPFGAVVVGGKRPVLVTTSITDGAVGFYGLDAADGAPRLVDVRHLGAGALGVVADPQLRAVWVASPLDRAVWRVWLDTSPGSASPPPVARRREPLRPQRLEFDERPPQPASPTPVVRVERIALPTVAAGTSFGQFLAMDPHGRQLLLTTRSPAGLALVDFVANAGAPRAILRGWVPLGTQPAGVALTPGPNGHRWAWVACFGDSAVYAVDLDALRVAAVIPTDKGPFDVLAMRVRSTDTWRVYVTLFDAHAVAVLDADPRSPTFGTLLAQVH